MDSPSVEHNSDSDSGESWTLLENNSVYADEAPEFIDEQARPDTQHHEKDEDTDGISIISDSDHETPSPPPLEHTVFEKCHLEENIKVAEHIPDYIPTAPHLPDTDTDGQDQIASEDFLGDSHAKHKTYVHRRNKRLSTVLNIIVLGSVITAAGVAIGHMWGAKNDCTMQTSSSVNKILSNLYKLQEENAYLRSKLKEFTILNNNQVQQHIFQNKHNKCRRVFEESLNSNDPRKVAKCVDESYKNVDNLMNHLVKPKYEKEFVADIDKLKTVYLQNKSWLDDEISRRMKIEEELLKKYNNEVKSGKEQKKDPTAEKNEPSSTNFVINNSKEQTLDNSIKIKIPNEDIKHKKVTYADSLQTEPIPRFKRDEKYARDEDDWVNSKNNINNFEPVKQDIIGNAESYQKRQLKSESDHKDFTNDFIRSLTDQEESNDHKEKYAIGDNWTEVKPKFRRNEERYETDYDKPVPDPKQKSYNKIQEHVSNDYIKEKSKVPNHKHSSTEQNNSGSNNANEEKNKGKKEKRLNKQSSRSWKNDSNENKVIENFVSEEDITKDDRYIVNKLKQAKKKNGYVNSSKKQKRKNKHDKWNEKGEFGDKYESIEIPEDFSLNSKYHMNIDKVSFIDDADDIDRVSNNNKGNRDKVEKFKFNMENNEKKPDNAEQANWFEKRAVFRTEARKKYYEQFAETSPNNSSWYFRRMRKREQCRAKGDNSTFRKIYKDKKNYKVKY